MFHAGPFYSAQSGVVVRAALYVLYHDRLISLWILEHQQRMSVSVDVSLPAFAEQFPFSFL